MNTQWLTLLRIIMNPRVTAVPRRILRTLRERGIRRIPEKVYDGLMSGTPRRSALSFIQEWLDGEILSRHRGQWVINSFMPPFPGTAFNRMFENLLSGRHLSPVSAYLAVTAACPYDCWHCSLHNRRKGTLSRETWRSAIRQLHELGVSLIGFTGGEPLLREDVPELVAEARQGGAATILFSSGACLTPAKAQALKQAGLWALCISLDHPSPEEFGRLRGSPVAYERAIASLRLGRETGFYTMMSTVATRSTIEQRLYLELYRLAQQLGLHEYRLIEPMPCGKLSGSSEELLLTPAHVQALRAFHVETNRRRRLPKVCAFNQIESPEIFGCGAGTQHLFIDSAGEVCPCDFTPLSFGNLEAAPLAEIWRRMNRAMGDNPRCHCFIQCYHRLVSPHAAQGFPLPPEVSEAVCAQTEKEPLPGYFAAVNHPGGSS